MATLKDKAEMLSQTSANIQVKNDVTQLGRRFESLLAAVKVCYVAYVSCLFVFSLLYLLQDEML